MVNKTKGFHWSGWKKEFNSVVDNGTTTVYIPTPKGWKCKVKTCHMKVKHRHTTYDQLSTSSHVTVRPPNDKMKSMKSPTKNSPLTKSAMSQLGSIGGKAIVRKKGKGYMKKLVSAYWKSPAGLARRVAAKAGAKKVE